jgi:predicted nucleic acid-binding Zn ribbon protein
MSEISLGDALRDYLRHSPFRQQMNEYRIQSLWEKEMGPAISRYTDSVRLVRSSLIITTSVAPLKQELSFSKEKILQRMNDALGEKLIEEVIIR